MAIQEIDLGTIIQDGTDGDAARIAFTKVNANFEELDERVTELENEPDDGVISINNIFPDINGNVQLIPSNIGAATAAQGVLADSAIQPGENISELNNDEGFVSQTSLTKGSLVAGPGIILDGVIADRLVGDGDVTITSTGSGGGTWGTISGTLSDQTDLQDALDGKVDVVVGKQLSTEDFTSVYKTKLDGIEVGAQVNVGTDIDQGIRTDSTVSLVSSTGDGGVLDAASATEAGVMTAAQFTKLAGIAPGATAIDDTDDLVEGIVNRYFTETRVRATPLTGLNISDDTDVVATDTVIQGLGKLQAQINAGGGSSGTGLPLLENIFYTGKRSQIAAAHPGSVPHDGQVLNRADWPGAWEAIQVQHDVVTDAAWLAGDYTKFSSGDGSTTFRVPDNNGAIMGHVRHVPRGTSGDGGGKTGHAMQGHRHAPLSSNATAMASFVPSGGVNTLGAGSFMAQDTTTGNPVTDGVNGTPQIANETRGASFDGVWLVRLANAAVNEGAVDVLELASQQALQGASIDGLQATLDQLDFKFAYPNGGSSGSPANVSINTRYVVPNPFPGHSLFCVLQYFLNGEWTDIFMTFYSTGTFGGSCGQRGDGIILLTGTIGLDGTSNIIGSISNNTALITTALCRVKVWKVKG